MTRYRLVTEHGAVQLHVASVTHVGKVRIVNEDSLLVEPPMFAVADGMGGHSFGDRASAAAVAALRDGVDPEKVTSPDRVFAAIRHANAAVRELTARAGGDPQLIAGTTLAGLALVEHPETDPCWMVVNLGDSRVYRISEAGGLEQITVDHSLVQELLDAGLLDPDGARRHPERNVITRALGAADDAEAEAWLLPATQRQIFLICSDGLTKELDDEQIAELVVPREPAETVDAVVDRLLTAALEAGGSDNVSILLVRSEYRGGFSTTSDVDEQTHERGRSSLTPELDDTRPRV